MIPALSRRSPLARPAPSGGGQVLPALDALRGVAILAVFAQHLGDRFLPFVEERITAVVPAEIAPWLLTVLHHAWWGVDLFFILSGFSLAQGYVRAFTQGRAPVSPAMFFRRRALRILPAFYGALFVNIVIHPERLASPGFGAAVGVNLVLLQGYLRPGGIVIIGAAWSLTTEAGFYLLFPWLARPLLARRPARLAAVLVLCLLVWASRAGLHAWLLEPGVRTAILEDSQRRWITSRLDQFALGAFAAALHAELTASAHAARIRRLAPIGLAVSAAALVIAFRLEGALYLTPGGSWPYALMSLGTTALVLAATLCEGAWLCLVAPRPLRALGIVSYGVFLYHQLSIGVVGHLLGDGSSWCALLSQASLSLGLASLLGLASWVLIEKPMLAR